MRLYLTQLLLPVAVIFLTSCDNKSNPWPAMAKLDLDYIKTMVELNHPGYVDPDNPQFKVQLEKNYKNVINQLQYVHSLDAVLNLDNEFIASFADYHVSISLRFSSNYKGWTGAKIERRHEKYLVTKLADNWPVALPSLGDELISCDGRSATEIMNYDILRYRYANYEAEYPRVRYASKLLIDDGVGFRKRSEKCVFRDAADKETTRDLQWKTIENSLTAEWDSNIVKPDVFSIETLNESVTWVRLPSFQAEGAEVEKLIDVLKSLATLNADAHKIIVFDVRGNGGGFLGSGTSVLQASYGTPALVNLFSKEINQDTNRLIRASQNNLDRVKKSVNIDSMSHDQQESYLGMIAELEQAIKNGLPFAKIPNHHIDLGIADERPTEEIQKTLPRLVVFTDYFCASECLSFVNLVLHEQRNLHIGMNTYADSTYSMIYPKNPFELPSKLGTFNTPLAIFGNNGPYVPSVKFDGDINDTAAVKNWVINQLTLN